MPGEHGAPRQREVDVLQHVTRTELQGLAWFECPPLAELERDVGVLRSREDVSARREVLELETTLTVGRRDTRFAKFRSRRDDASAPQWRSGVARHDAAADCRRRRGLRIVPRRYWRLGRRNIASSRY